MKLNLGSNTVRYEEFLNVDIRDVQGVDIVDNVMKLSTIEDNTVEAIIAHNILEHIAPDKTISCLNLWVKKLVVGGTLQIGVPDGELIFERWQDGISTRPQYIHCPWKDVIHSIFGNMEIMREMHGDDTEKYMHHTLFCESFLRECMEEVGIIDIIKIKPNHPDVVTLRGVKK